MSCKYDVTDVRQYRERARVIDPRSSYILILKIHRENTFQLNRYLSKCMKKIVFSFFFFLIST